MRNRIALLAVAAAALIGAAQAGAATQVSVTSPVDGAHSLAGVVQVAVSASADNGIYSVQLYVDGQAYGIPDTMAVGLYQYVIPWDTSTVAIGTHTLSALATDWSGTGATTMSTPIGVDVGPAYPTIQIAAPQAWSFVRGTTAIQTVATSAVGSGTISLSVDGAPASAAWNTTTVADGSHTVGATIVDGRGKSAASTVAVTVDNTPPATYVAAPGPNAYASGTLPVQAQASDAYGVASVQFAVDGAKVGAALGAPDTPGGYAYSTTLDVSKLSAGAHSLTSIATDAAGNQATSSAVAFTIGTAPPTVAVTAPADWSFVRKTVPVTGLASGGTAPLRVQLLVDGTASGAPVAATAFSLPLDTTKLMDGSHTLAVQAVDAAGRTATSAPLHETVDNTAPAAVLYQPASGARTNGPTTLQVHASDAYGVASVQFTVDGSPVGALLKAPDPGQQYLYSLVYDTSLLVAGSHVVGAVVTDNAGNAGSAAGVPIKTGPIEYLPVLNYHEISPTTYSIYDQTPAEADAQLAYLRQNGYQSVTLAQYQAWLGGANIGIAKPVLITVDDGLVTELAWDALLKKYGFTAVLFVITGYADQLTPGDQDPNNMTWAQIQSLARNGRWEIAFHAGLYGHGDSYATGYPIGNLGYQTACPYFYTCFGQYTTGWGRHRTVTPETFAQYQFMVTSEVASGIAELKQKVPTASPLAWAAPFNDAGQWTTFYNDPTGQAQNWLPGYMASKFPIVFVQTNPILYAQASGTVGSLFGLNRHYRFEVHTDTTIPQFGTALADPAFAR